MTEFDKQFILFLNSYANHWQRFDSVVLLLRITDLLKGGVICALIWWAWFRSESDQKRSRAVILSTLVAAFGAMFTARALSLILPFVARPLHNPEMEFQLPYGMEPEIFDEWSSFPSDHAALFFCLAAGLWLVSRRLGIVALLQTVFVISFPRLYDGLHYPTDILAGAGIGLAWCGLMNMSLIKKRFLPPLQHWLEHHPMSFYAAFFLLTEQIATIFQDARTVGKFILGIMARRFFHVGILACLLIIHPLASAQTPFTLSDQDEVALGRHAAGEIEKDLRLIEDAAIVQYVDKLGQALVQKSGRSGIAYTFKVVDTPEINAFALPGGFIYVNRGLIEAADSENELAGVLAHEIGHVVGRHGAQQAQRASLTQTGLGILGGLLGRGTAANVSQIAAQMVTEGVFMKFSREAEREADRLGARMLFDSSFRPQGMVSFFNKLAGLQKQQPNAVQKFFYSHPSPTERSQNIADLIARYQTNDTLISDEPAFHDAKTRLTALPRPEVEAAKAAEAIAAAALPPAEPKPEVRSRNLTRDRQVAARFAPIFHQALGSAPRFDYITNFDFDGDWQGDNNWTNAENRKFPLKAYVYYAVFETRTHFLIHYAAFHPRDYKGGEKRGASLSEVIRLGVKLGGQYDPTGRSSEAVMAHENDLEGAVVVAEKNGDDPAKARLVLVETLAHNNYLKYTPQGSPLSGDPILVEGGRPGLFVESKGHGIEAWRDDDYQRKQAENGFRIYSFTGKAGDPDSSGDSVGYDLIPTLDALWPRAVAGQNETYGEQHDYGVVPVRFVQGAEEVERYIRLGVKGSALNGKVGAANMSRPPWGWFDGQDSKRPLGEWFLQPAETIRRHWNLPESFSTAYVYHPFLGQFR